MKNWLHNKEDDMFGEPEGATAEALGERVATLYKRLSYPSASRFQAALAKRGINVPEHS